MIRQGKVRKPPKENIQEANEEEEEFKVEFEKSMKRLRRIRLILAAKNPNSEFSNFLQTKNNERILLRAKTNMAIVSNKFKN